jgi:molybdopterin converting factor subunit 1
MIRVRVLFFGRLKDIVGKSEEDAELSDGARVEDLFTRYGRKFPELTRFRSNVVASVNQEFADWRTQLSSGDEIAFLPPVSGGSASENPTGTSGGPETFGADTCALVRETILTAPILAEMKAPPDGGVVIFEGIVRNHSGNRPTLHLEYEAYEPMAIAKMREIGQQMHERFAIRRIAMIHRLGKTEIGETAVLIIVCAAHRGAAFDACRYGIDTLKRTVPIWKKEFFKDGAVWAEGETPSA